MTSYISDLYPLSIVVPMYNEEKTVPFLLQSLEKQTLKDFQVICVDNGSSDNTRKVVLNTSNGLSFPVYLLNEDKPGPGSARKRGGEFVLNRLGKQKGSLSGCILATTDADCVISPDWTQSIVNIFSINEKCGIAGGAHTAHPLIDEEIHRQIGIPGYFKKVADINQFVAEEGVGIIKLSGPNSAMNLLAYEKAGGFSQPLNSDGSIGVKELSDLGGRVVRAGYSVSFIPSLVFSSRRRHLQELIKKHDMYFWDKNDSSKRFISIRDSENELLRLAIKEVALERWVSYQNELVCRVIYNMVLKPAMEGKLSLTSLKRINLGTAVIVNIQNKIDSVKMSRLDFQNLYSEAPDIFQVISEALDQVLINEEKIISQS